MPPAVTLNGDALWTGAILLAGAISLASLISFTQGATDEEGLDWLFGQENGGRTRSISQMIVDSEPYIQGRGFAGMNVSMVLILAHFLHNVYPTLQVAFSSFPKSTKLLFASFLISTCSVQSVITVTYRQGLVLHFSFAGFFFLFAAVISFTSSYLEYKSWSTSYSERTLPSKIRLVLVHLSTVVMFLTWFLFGLSVITYSDIERIGHQ
ncbi:hypothetical protein TrVE_jg12264 [Triparma verrucosa]|uniref:Uncharacterized protein n=1 Tax=Triparma verrucosa TaxID=1606542 RepID=A0A9W7BFV9_9STRA|nr:hypothetical protein TrVE_jg12264 [Triparma verrucosa]